MTNLSYQAQQVRNLDRDRFYMTVFSDETRREGLFSLYAFNLEIAMIREKVTEPLLGKMRIQWWRDNLEGIFKGTPPEHEVAVALSETVSKVSLDRGLFEKLLKARERDLDDTPFATEQDLMTYIDGTTVPLQTLALQVVGEAGDAVEEAARRLALAHGLTGLVRAIPYHTAWNRNLLPVSLCREMDFNEASLFRKDWDRNLCKVVAVLCQRAEDHLAMARKFKPSKKAMPIFLNGVLVDHYIKGLASVGFDPFAYYQKSQQSSGLGLLLKLKYHNWRRRI